MLASLRCDLRISQLVDPNVTVKFAVPPDLRSEMPPIADLLASKSDFW